MEEFKKQFLEVNPNIKSLVDVGEAGIGKWKQMSDAEKAPYIAVAEKRRVEYVKIMEAYNRRMTAGYAKKEESDKSRSDVNPSSGSKYGENPCYTPLGDKSDAEAMKKKAPGLKNVRKFATGRDKPKRSVSAFFIFMDEFSKQFPEMNPSIESIVALGTASGGKWNQMSDAEKAPYIAEEEKRKTIL